MSSIAAASRTDAPTEEVRRGWPVVLACFFTATFAWGFGFYGNSVYVAVLHDERGRSPRLTRRCGAMFSCTTRMRQIRSMHTPAKQTLNVRASSKLFTGPELISMIARNGVRLPLEDLTWLRRS